MSLQNIIYNFKTLFYFSVGDIITLIELRVFNKKKVL